MKDSLLQILKSYYLSNTKAPLLSNASVYVQYKSGIAPLVPLVRIKTIPDSANPKYSLNSR
jgi:hypothetical protein